MGNTFFKASTKGTLFIVAGVILLLSGIVSLALSYFGVNALLFGPVCSLLGVSIFIQIFPVGSYDSELHLVPQIPSIYKSSHSNLFIDNINIIIEASSFKQILLDTNFNKIVLSPRTGEIANRLINELKVAQKTKDHLLVEHINAVAETYTSTGKLLDASDQEFFVDNRSHQVRVQAIVDPYNGNLYFLMNLSENLLHQPMSIMQPEFAKFCSSLAHDLNNLFSGLATSLGLLRKQTQASLTERQIKLLSNLSHIATSGARLSKDLLDFSKQRVMQAEVKSVNLTQVIEEVSSLLEAEARMENIKFTVKIDPHTWVAATEQGLHQVLINLIYNSLDAFKASGEISVIVRAADRKVYIEVADNGCGMTEATLAAIFDPFFTTKRDTSKGKYLGGSGLGLTNVKALIETWGGRIFCQSREGIGTVFYIELTRAEKDSTRPSNKSAAYT